MASQLKTRLFFIQMVKNAIYTPQNNNEMLMQYIVQLLSKRVLFGNRHYLEMLQLFTLDHRMLHEHNIRHTEQWLYSYTKTNTRSYFCKYVSHQSSRCLHSTNNKKM